MVGCDGQGLGMCLELQGSGFPTQQPLIRNGARDSQPLHRHVGGQLSTKPIYNFDIKVPLCCSIKHRFGEMFVLKVSHQTVSVVHYYIQKVSIRQDWIYPTAFLICCLNRQPEKPPNRATGTEDKTRDE